VEGRAALRPAEQAPGASQAAPSTAVVLYKAPSAWSLTSFSLGCLQVEVGCTTQLLLCGMIGGIGWRSRQNDLQLLSGGRRAAVDRSAPQLLPPRAPSLAGVPAPGKGGLCRARMCCAICKPHWPGAWARRRCSGSGVLSAQPARLHTLLRSAPLLCSLLAPAPAHPLNPPTCCLKVPALDTSADLVGADAASAHLPLPLAELAAARTMIDYLKHKVRGGGCLPVEGATLMQAVSCLNVRQARIWHLGGAKRRSLRS